MLRIQKMPWRSAKSINYQLKSSMPRLSRTITIWISSIGPLRISSPSASPQVYIFGMLPIPKSTSCVTWEFLTQPPLLHGLWKALTSPWELITVTFRFGISWRQKKYEHYQDIQIELEPLLGALLCSVQAHAIKLYFNATCEPVLHLWISWSGTNNKFVG